MVNNEFGRIVFGLGPWSLSSSSSSSLFFLLFLFFFFSPFYLSSSFSGFFIILQSIEIKLTLSWLYDYFRALKLPQDVAHLLNQFYSIANFILFCFWKVKQFTLVIHLFIYLVKAIDYLIILLCMFLFPKERWER